MTTGQFVLGYIQDEADRSKLLTLLAQTNPSEVIYHPKNLSPSVVKMIKFRAIKPTVTPFDAGEAGNKETAAKEFIATELRSRDDIPPLPEEIDDLLLEQPVVLALATGVKYLESCLMKDSVLPIANWEVYCGGGAGVAAGGGAAGTTSSSAAKNGTQNRYMIVDNTALENLEVLRTSDGKREGSLMDFVNKTKTKFGYRLLERWICNPLMDVAEIRRRQDVVEFLIADKAWRVLTAAKELSTFPDMERQFARVGTNLAGGRGFENDARNLKNSVGSEW